MRVFKSIGLPAFFMLVAGIMLSRLFGCADQAARLRDMPKDSQGVPMLKDIYKKDFLIGTALDIRSPREFSPRELEIIKSQFNIITPENSMKPQIQPGPDRWNWATADALVSFCQQNNIKIHGHTLAWHAQTPNWFFVDDDGKTVTRETAIARLKEHIQTEVGHFKGKIFSWDVVNEAINDSGPGNRENLRNSPWVRVIGPDYITMAFKWAHEADPDALLFYNDYNIERGAKHQSSLLLLQRLIRDGAPINGVGIQGHWSINNTPYKDIDKAISDYKALGLKVAISELDITISGQGGGQLTPTTGPATQAAPFGRGRGRGFFGRGGAATAPATSPAGSEPAATGPAQAGTVATAPSETEVATTEPVATGAANANTAATGPAATGPAATGPATTRPGFARGFGRGGRGFGPGSGFGAPSTPPTPLQLKAQADAYARVFEIFQKHKDVIVRVTIWGINDRRSWRAGQHPLIFDNDNNPKPAIQAIALAKQWEW